MVYGHGTGSSEGPEKKEPSVVWTAGKKKTMWEDPSKILVDNKNFLKRTNAKQRVGLVWFLFGGCCGGGGWGGGLWGVFGWVFGGCGGVVGFLVWGGGGFWGVGGFFVVSKKKNEPAKELEVTEISLESAYLL